MNRELFEIAMERIRLQSVRGEIAVQNPRDGGIVGSALREVDKAEEMLNKLEAAILNSILDEKPNSLARMDMKLIQEILRKEAITKKYFSPAIYDALESAFIIDFGTLTEFSENDLLSIPALQLIGVSEIKNVLISLGMSLPLNDKLNRKPKIRQIISPEMFDTSIDVLDLPIRIKNCLVNAAHITTVGQLLRQTKEELMKCPNLGEKSIAELELILSNRGFALGSMPEQKTETQKTSVFDVAECGELDNRTCDCLLAEDILFIEQLAEYTEGDLSVLKNIDAKALANIKEFMAKRNLSFRVIED